MPHIFGCKQTPKTPPTTSDEESSGSTSDADMKKTKGNRAMGKKKYPKAIKYYSKAIKIDPRNPTYRLNRAIANSALELWKDAEADAAAAVELSDPQAAAKGYYHLAKAKLRRGLCEEAKQSLAEGMKSCPGESALKQLANEIEQAVEQLAARRKREEEQEARRSAPALGPQGAKVLLDQGRSAYEAGRLEEAERLLSEARRASVDLQEACAQGGQSVREDGRRIEISTLSVQGKLFMRLKRWQDAVDTFKSVITLEEAAFSPMCKDEREALSNAYNNLGIALKNAGCMKEAVEALNNSYLRATNGDDQVATLQTAQILQNMGQCHMADRKAAEARAAYERALDISQRLLGPESAGNALGWICLARAFRAEARLKDAIQAYTKALEIWAPLKAEECLAVMPEVPSKDRLEQVQNQCKQELAQLLSFAEQAQAQSRAASSEDSEAAASSSQ